MIPLYGFLEGDTMGLLILAYGDDTVARLAERLIDSASVRVEKKSGLRVHYRGAVLDPELKLSTLRIRPLERFDVRMDVLVGEER